MSNRNVREIWISAGAAVLIVLLSVFSSHAAQNDAAPSDGRDWSVFLPNAENKDLVVKNCGMCHDLSKIVVLRGDKAFWSDTIYSMFNNGADFTNEDIETISTYLSTHLTTNLSTLSVPININTAKPEVLRLLAPIAKQVDAIVQARDKGMKFEKLEDLMKIDGVTPEAFQKVKLFLSVG